MQLIILFFYLSIFLLLAFTVFYIPGFLLINTLKSVNKDILRIQIVTLSSCIGVISFVLLAILLGFLNLRVFMLPLIGTVCLYSLVKFKFDLFLPWSSFFKDRTLVLLIFIGILVQGFINFPSGFLFNDGLLFWSSQGHDGMWHVALMEEVKKQFPPRSPIFAGENLYNYHYLVDVLMGDFYRTFPFFSALDLYFRFFPVLFSWLYGLSVFSFITHWRSSSRIGYLGVFFSYFVGSFGFIVTFIQNGKIFGGETVFWAAQQNTILGNPPHAVSHFILPAFFLSLAIFLKKRNVGWFLISLLLGSTLAGYKVSGGLVLLIGVGAGAFVDLIFNRKIQTLLLSCVLGVSNFVTFKLMTSPEAASFLMFLPWWFIRTMIVVKLDWVDLEHKRQHYLSVGTWKAYLRVVQLETMALLIFIVGNLGMRVLGLLALVKSVNLSVLKSPLDIALIVSMITGFIMPIFFVQKGIIYNNIQFMQYFLLIFGFYAAVSVYYILQKGRNRIFRIIFFLILITLSVPTVIGNFVEFYNRPAYAYISNAEIDALKYLKNNSQENDIILNLPFDKDLKNKFTTQPWPIYAWYSTAYISALSGRRSYLASEEQVLITGYPLENRLAQVRTFFKQGEIKRGDFLKTEKIKYIYIPKKEITEGIDFEKNNLKIWFENEGVIIYEVE